LIGIDTNVLVRYIAQDDPAQSRRATLFIERECSESNPGFVGLVVMAEVVCRCDSLMTKATILVDETCSRVGFCLR